MNLRIISTNNYIDLNSTNERLIGSGDQDAVIPLLGTRTLVNKLAKALKLNDTLPYSPWFYKQQVIVYMLLSNFNHLT